MLKRARYIHYHLPRGQHTNGFSAEIAPIDFFAAPVEDSPDDPHCYFRITICSSKDQFSRAIARAELAQKPWQEVRVVDVPKLLGDYDYFCRYGTKLADQTGNPRYWHNLWAWVYKYFL